MDATERPLEEIEEGDVVLHDGRPRLVESVETSKAGKSGSAKVTLTFAHADDRLIDPADATVPTLELDHESNPMITVGGERQDFEPDVVRVAPGTPVVWFWSGDGGTHRVVGDDFQSMAQDQGGYTVKRSYDDPGIYAFRCDTHDAEGFVIVDERD